MAQQNPHSLNIGYRWSDVNNINNATYTFVLSKTIVCVQISI